MHKLYALPNCCTAAPSTAVPDRLILRLRLHRAILNVRQEEIGNFSLFATENGSRLRGNKTADRFRVFASRVVFVQIESDSML